jgi:transcription initiation factor IIF auxiliary subunit
MTKLARYTLVVALFDCWISGTLQTSYAQPKALPFNNTAKYVGNGRYDWTVFVDADAATLAQIKSVEYTLDPTFPNPVRTVSKRENKFALSSSGWGVFTMYIKVSFADGKVGNYRYPLRFSKPTYGQKEQSFPETAGKDHRAQTLPPSATEETINLDTEAITTGNTSKKIGGGTWEWSVFIVARDMLLKQVSYVEYTLHPTFADPIQRVTQRGLEKGKGFVLTATGWGTFEIAVKVAFVNGKTRFLKHQLKFG